MKQGIISAAQNLIKFRYKTPKTLPSSWQTLTKCSLDAAIGVMNTYKQQVALLDVHCILALSPGSNPWKEEFLQTPPPCLCPTPWLECILQKFRGWESNLQINILTEFGSRALGRWLGFDAVVRVGSCGREISQLWCSMKAADADTLHMDFLAP